MKKIISLFVLFSIIVSVNLYAQKSRSFQLTSPNGNITVRVDAGEKLQWSVKSQSQVVIAPSAISMHLQTGETLGDNANIISSKTEKINNVIAALNYKKNSVEDNYDQLTLNCKGDYGIIFRVYNDGVAYRFFIKKKDSIIVQSEEANFNFVESGQ